MSLPHLETDAEGFVLAGGQSSRMGQDKAFTQLAGTPLIQRALEILRGAGLDTRIAGARTDLSAFARVIPDKPQQTALGPLSGICAALAAANTRYGVFLPVDLPLIPATLITYLLHHTAVTQPAITVMSVAGFIQTFPAVIDRAAASSLQASLRSDDRKCLNAFQKAARALASSFSVLPIELLVQSGQLPEPAGLPVQAWFHNINSPQDVARAEALLGAVIK